MTPLEAEKIVNEYLKSIKDLRPNGIAQSIDDLPYPSGRIKQAYFVYAEELIKTRKLTKEIGDMLMRTYSLINAQFTEDFEAINNQYRKTLEGLERDEIIEDPVISLAGAQIGPEIEFNNFLADCIERQRTSKDTAEL